MPQPDNLAKMLKVLSVGTRVRIVQLLKQRVLCVGALSARLDVTQGAVSQHLRILRDAGLVTPEKRGYYVHYRLNADVLARWNRAIGTLLRTGADSACTETAKKKAKETQRCLMRRKAARSRKS